ncbi:MAG: hypothetical protein PWR27_2056 [Petroclostridium sp.]|jgi:TusA-related sulfurtransferase|uniref:sulfurtransferase TusA family protein n=1 Tax=Petroclostridium xylanilyticum TaxID=1792311 RepID=UPI000B9915B4|nr:sulfurtransferase TusA family protein [Petroclostridium xylanilyticum]MBZ4645498.1 hypothetical protein [Clostridia bacterium]MDK2811347.1 hypothetical protein [Petroclostridium sp.]
MEFVVDCLGDICPIPSIKAYEKFKAINKNDTIKIITDHSCSCKNIIERFQNLNCIISQTEPIPGVWEIYITKT